MNSAPDRPHQSLTQYDLDQRIQHNRDQQSLVVGGRTQESRRTLGQLKRELSDLINERNWREDLQQLPF